MRVANTLLQASHRLEFHWKSVVWCHVVHSMHVDSCHAQPPSAIKATEAYYMSRPTDVCVSAVHHTVNHILYSDTIVVVVAHPNKLKTMTHRGRGRYKSKILLHPHRGWRLEVCMKWKTYCKNHSNYFLLSWVVQATCESRHTRNEKK